MIRGHRMWLKSSFHFLPAIPCSVIALPCRVFEEFPVFQNDKDPINHFTAGLLDCLEAEVANISGHSAPKGRKKETLSMFSIVIHMARALRKCPWYGCKMNEARKRPRINQCLTLIQQFFIVSKQWVNAADSVLVITI